MHWDRHRGEFVQRGKHPVRGDRWNKSIGNQTFYNDGAHMYFEMVVQGSHKPPRISHIAYARIPVDRFVAMRSNAVEPGRLRTLAVQFETGIDEMLLNAKVAEEGRVRVQVVNDKGKAVRGFRFRDCEPIRGDGIYLPVRWNKRSLADLAGDGRTYRLEFEIERGEIYAFYLGGPGWIGPEDDVIVPDGPAPQRKQTVDRLSDDADRTIQAIGTGINKSSNYVGKFKIHVNTQDEPIEVPVNYRLR